MYSLMNKDVEIATLDYETSFGQDIFNVVNRTNHRLPYGFQDINSWIDSRCVAKHRKHITELLKLSNMETRSGFLGMTRGLSLNDTYWVKDKDSDLTWSDVSLYRHPFDEVVSRIAFDGVGLRGLQFSSTSPEFATEGNFEKCWIRDGNTIQLFKRGSEGASNAGMEPYSETLAAQLASAFNVFHVPYGLTKYHDKLASVCDLFTTENIGFVSMNKYAIEKGREVIDVKDVVDYCEPYDLKDKFFRMIVFDALILNVDRHLGNYGFIVDNDTGTILDFAPLFDHNLSLVPYLKEVDDVEEYINKQTPKIGTDFIGIAKEVLTPELQVDLINLKGFKFKDPGYDFPEWRLKVLNNIVERNINLILGRNIYNNLSHNNIKDKNK